MPRSFLQKTKDIFTFPLRAFLLFHEDKFGLSCQATERYDYAASQVRGRCLDVGCGSNRFVNEFCSADSLGVDVFKYPDNKNGVIIEDLTKFPWPDASFDSVTFLANINHVPKESRDAELAESFRVTREGGNIIVTMALPIVEIIVHQVVWLYDRLFGTKLDHDNERGMVEGEEYYLTGTEIRERLTRAGYRRIEYKPFWTQWALNGMYIGWKE